MELATNRLIPIGGVTKSIAKEITIMTRNESDRHRLLSLPAGKNGVHKHADYQQHYYG
jgi:hypothetical protein